jgi:Ca2+-binding EF-hand superfamily protein
MKRLLGVPAIGAVLALGLNTATAQGAPPTAPPSPADRYLATMLHSNLTLERYLDRLRRQFRQADADRNGTVDSADDALLAKMAAASLRAMLVATIFRADLDGDGIVTEDELRRLLTIQRQHISGPHVTEAQVQSQIEHELRTMMAADTDRDGRITFTEAVNSARDRPEFMRSAPSLGGVAKRMLVLAPQGKGAVTLSDIEPRAEALFRTVDTDSNGTVSADELKAYRARPGQPGAMARQAAELAMQGRDRRRTELDALRARKEAEKRAACAMPKASDAAKVVLIGAYQAEAVSSVTIGSQDVAVGAGTINIEPGDEPIYLVVTSFRPTIWRLYGAVERVERLVLSATMTGPGRGMPQEKPLVGATGVPAERVSFLGQSRCIRYFTETPSSSAAAAAASVRQETGKDASTIAARYGLSEVSVPSGRIRNVERAHSNKLVIVKQAGTLTIEGDPRNVIVQTGRGELEGDLKRFNPGGVVEIDPKRVVASLPAERYQVLPQQAGLLQLVQSGALARNRSGEFLIRRKIRFPAELNGAHSVKFLLLKGVPMPDGDPGHSSVISEETGEALKLERGRR